MPGVKFSVNGMASDDGELEHAGLSAPSDRYKYQTCDWPKPVFSNPKNNRIANRVDLNAVFI